MKDILCIGAESDDVQAYLRYRMLQSLIVGKQLHVGAKLRENILNSLEHIDKFFEVLVEFACNLVWNKISK